MKYWLTALSKLAQEKCVVGLTDCLDMTIAVDWGFKLQTKQTKDMVRNSLLIKKNAACNFWDKGRQFICLL